MVINVRDLFSCRFRHTSNRHKKYKYFLVKYITGNYNSIDRKIDSH